MKAIIALAVLFALPAFAADSEDSATHTVDHSKNPMTGSHTTKEKKTHKKKNEDGSASAPTNTATTKVSKAGDVKKETKTEETTTH